MASHYERLRVSVWDCGRYGLRRPSSHDSLDSTNDWSVSRSVATELFWSVLSFLLTITAASQQSFNGRFRLLRWGIGLGCAFHSLGQCKSRYHAKTDKRKEIQEFSHQLSFTYC